MTRAYWLSVLERAVKTAAQTLVALISTTAVLSEIDWAVVGGGVVIATLLSVATSLTSISFAPGDGPAAFGPEKVDA